VKSRNEPSHFFTVNGLDRKALDTDSVFQAVKARDYKRMSRTRNGTTLGQDGIQRKAISGQDVKEIMRLLYNAILISKRADGLNTKTTILIPKQEKDLSKVKKLQTNHNQLSHMACILGHSGHETKRLYHFHQRPHIDKIIRSVKDRSGLTATQLNISNTFNSNTH
jgi:hypothetical protein